MPPTLQDSRTALELASAAVKANCERTVELMDLMDGEKNPTEEQLNGWNEEFEALKAEHPKLRATEDQLAAQDSHLAAVKGDLQRLARPISPMNFGPQGGQPQGAPSIGRQFVESDVYRDWLKAAAPTGRVPDRNGALGAVPNSAALKVNSSLKTIITGQSAWTVPADTSGSAFVRPQFMGLIDRGVYQIPLGIADLPRQETTDAEVVMYVKVNTGSAVAAITPEATSTSDSAALKPEGALSFTQGLQFVRTIAIWVPVTRQAAASAAGLMAEVEDYLRYEVQRALSNEILNGDGTGQHFTGVYHLAGKLTQGWDTDEIVTGRKAITNLLLNGRVMPTAWAMHPTDAERVDLTRDLEARYYFGGPAQAAGVPSFWGVPVRQSEFVTLGSPILADWTKSILFDREETTLRMTDSHSDYFTHNLLAVLVEGRWAWVSARDQGFVIVTFQ